MAEYRGFDPSEKKLETERRKGHVFYCATLSQAIVFICVIGLTAFLLQSNVLRSKMLLDLAIIADADPATALKKVLWYVAMLSGIPLGVGMCVALIYGGMQTKGLQFHFSALALQEGRINLAQGLGKVFCGLKSFPWLVLKFSAVGVVMTKLTAGVFFDGTVLNIGSEALLDSFVKSQVLKVGAVGSFILLMCAVAEFFWQQKKFIAQMSMSQDEVRREYKEEDGDPMMKAFRHQMHQSISMEELQTQVRKSKCIVVERM